MTAETRLACKRRASARAERVAEFEEAKRLRLMYKGMSEEQAKEQRCRRFVKRSWKVPQAERHEKWQCVACLESDTNPMMFLACDHGMHVECYFKHARAHMERVGIPLVDNMSMDVSAERRQMVAAVNAMMEAAGAPCPMCRLPYPNRHMVHLRGGPMMLCRLP